MEQPTNSDTPVYRIPKEAFVVDCDEAEFFGPDWTKLADSKLPVSPVENHPPAPVKLFP